MSEIWKPPTNLMHEDVNQFVRGAVDLVNKSRKRTNLTCDRSLQKEMRRHLTALAHESVRQKKNAIRRGDENEANLILCFECIADALRTELQMWMLLKQDYYDQAWNSLIQAQNIADAARRAHDISEKFRINEYQTRLRATEKIVFPDQTFNSPGVLVKTRICTICGDNYGKCSHISGRPYWGEFCQVKMEDVIHIDHLALVDEPADKAARVHSFSGTDIMTGLPLEDIPDERKAKQMAETDDE